MELPQLLQNQPADTSHGVSGAGQSRTEAKGRGDQAKKLAQSAQTLTAEQVSAYKDQQLDYKFRLNPFLLGALEKAVAYMNRTLERDGLQMEIKHDATGEVVSAPVKDINNNEKIVKEYDPQDVLRYYAHSGYGSGVVIDGKI